jgi:hypothetical protein
MQTGEFVNDFSDQSKSFSIFQTPEYNFKSRPGKIDA